MSVEPSYPWEYRATNTEAFRETRVSQSTWASSRPPDTAAVTEAALIQPRQSEGIRFVSHSERLLAFTVPCHPETSTRRPAPNPPTRYPVDASRSVSMKKRNVSIVGGESPPWRAVPFTSAENARQS